VFVRVLPLAFGRTSTWPVLTSMKVLNEVLAELKRDPGAPIELVGHTSNDGNPKPDVDNLIARVRAEAAKTILVSLGIKPERIRVRSAGADESLAPNDIEKNRRRNRRVVVKMYARAHE
jgi:outer membrane protein OmpA-like peptidoglycan-associated protein